MAVEPQFKHTGKSSEVDPFRITRQDDTCPRTIDFTRLAPSGFERISFGGFRSSVDCLRVLFCYRLAALLLLAVFALAINRVSLWCGVGSRYTRSASPLANSTLTGWKSRISLFVHLPQVAN
ncbi:unnamed protein product [Mesocestoides corti]|uniref:Uncharacterized protein n=1 Tax=Mesocestoides corti TaxID=53468 RepID=A0A3P6HK21_MESCO|nr:unnamed protein product [Mesocestoides corti]